MTSTERRRQWRLVVLRRRELVALRAAADRTPQPRVQPSADATTAPDE
ncbi:MAG: hypothetical protein ACTHLJ_04670 [Angustibacter sp.]